MNNIKSHSTITSSLSLSKLVCICTSLIIHTTLFTSIQLTTKSTVTYTFCNAFAHALTLTPRTQTRLNAAIRRNSDLSGYSIDDLRKIAAKKGYDTTGMDRAGLENIAIGWSTKQTPNFPFDNNMNTGMRSANINPNNPNSSASSNADPSSLPKLQPAITNVNNGMNNSYQSSGRQEPTIWQRQRMEQQQEQMRQEQMEQQMRQEQRSVRQQEIMRQQQMQQQQMQQQQQEIMRQQQMQQMQQQQMQRQPLMSQSPQQPSLPNNNNNNSQTQFQSPYNSQQRPQQYDASSQTNNYNNSFSIRNMSQPMKAFGIGFFSGFIAVSPVTFTHHTFFPAEIITNTESQWLFDTFTGAIAAGAFATVYRYFVKEVKDDNLVSFSFSLLF
jgi:hypothetical protein